MTDTFYAQLAESYDRMIPWERRLERERPYFERLFRAEGARSVLDAACGTGRHLELFAEMGLDAVGTDASSEMVAQAERWMAERRQTGKTEPAEAGAAGDAPRLVQSTWAALPRRVGRRFDAVLCLGNSLPHVATRRALKTALRGLWSRVAPGGFLLIQYKNFAALRARGETLLPLTTHTDPVTGAETLHIRQYTWYRRRVDFKIVVLQRDALGQPWRMRAQTTPLRTWLPDEVADELTQLGTTVQWAGSLALEPFAPEGSPDVVLMARSRAAADADSRPTPPARP